MSRIQRDEFFLALASLTSRRSTCERRAVGAILVADNRIVSAGYNGSPSGSPHCKDKGCLGETKRGGSCKRTIHAEVNAVLHGIDIGNWNNLVLYCTDEPCLECTKVILTAKIDRVVFLRDYKDKMRDKFIQESSESFDLNYIGQGLIWEKFFDEGAKEITPEQLLRRVSFGKRMSTYLLDRDRKLPSRVDVSRRSTRRR